MRFGSITFSSFTSHVLLSALVFPLGFVRYSFVGCGQCVSEKGKQTKLICLKMFTGKKNQKMYIVLFDAK